MLNTTATYIPGPSEKPVAHVLKRLEDYNPTLKTKTLRVFNSPIGENRSDETGSSLTLAFLISGLNVREVSALDDALLQFQQN